MNSTFNMTAWLIQTFVLMGAFLLLIPVAKTALGLMLIAFGNGFTLKNQSLRNAGLKLLPAFVKAVLGLGVGIGIGGLISAPAQAEPNRVTPVVQTTTFDVIQVQPGDSLWNIALEHLRQQNQNVTIGEVDSFWRLLWDVNRNVLGEDPGRLKPGITLNVPTSGQVRNAFH